MNRKGFVSAIVVLAFAALSSAAPAQAAPPDAAAVFATPTTLISHDVTSLPTVGRDTARVIPSVIAGVVSSTQRAPMPAKRDRIPMPLEMVGLGAALLGTKRSRRASSDDEPEGSATEKPDYGEKDHPQPTAPNRTDAEGVDSNWQAPAGVDPTAATPHTTPEVTDPGYRERQIQETRNRGEVLKNEERLPQVLTGGYDVRRGEQIYRIPAGTVVEDAELTDDEWDHIVRNNLVRPASYAEVMQAKRRAETDATDAKLLEQRKAQIGAKPKGSAGKKAPAGAALVADLETGRAEVAEAQVARSIAREEVQRGTKERAKMLSGKKS